MNWCVLGWVLLVLTLFRIVCVTVAHRSKQSRFWWTLNRWRAALAFEEDPGPWRKGT